MIRNPRTVFLSCAAALTAAVLVVLAADPAAADVLSETVITIPPVWLPIVVGILTPELTGLATKLSASSGTKAIVGLVVVIVGVLVERLISGPITGQQLWELFQATAVTHVVAFWGLTRHLGGGATVTQRATPEIGVG